MTEIRNNWTREEISAIYNQPTLELIYNAATVHREFNDPQEVQVCTLLSVKTGGCPEDCSYCPQAARYHTDVKVHKLLPTEEVLHGCCLERSKGQ
jgi:biotin synthase